MSSHSEQLLSPSMHDACCNINTRVSSYPLWCQKMLLSSSSPHIVHLRNPAALSSLSVKLVCITAGFSDVTSITVV